MKTISKYLLILYLVFGITVVAVAGGVPYTGSVPVDEIDATGTKSSSTYLRGDGSWQTPSALDIPSLTARTDTSSGSLDAAVLLANSGGVNYKITGENFLDWLIEEGFGSITDVDLLPGDTVDDNQVDLAILPNTISTTGHTHTTTTISGLDISDDTNLAGTANQITLTGDTLSLATAITLPGTLTGGGIILGDTSPDTNGEIGYASSSYYLFANSEDLSLAASADTWSFGSSTGVATIAFPSLTVSAESFSASADVLVSDDVLLQDDLQMDSDAAIIFFGEDNEVTVTHVADTGLLLNAAMQWQFRDSASYIASLNASHLDITSPQIDLNGYVVTSSSMSTGGGGFLVDSVGNTTVKSFTITRTSGTSGTWTGYEDPDIGDNFAQWITPLNLAANVSLYMPSSLPSTDGLIPTYNSEGTFNSWVSNAAGGLANIVEDTTPQLGGDLDLNGHTITAFVAADFGLTADADAGDFDILSIDKLEGIDATEYIDMGADGYVDIAAGTAIRILGDMTISGGLTVSTAGITIPQGSTETSVTYYEASENGTEKITLKSPAALGGDYTVTLPSATGTLALSGSLITLQNGEVISNATDTEIEFQGDEHLTLDLDTATDNEVGISTDTGVTQLNFNAIALLTTGQIRGAVDVNLISTATTMGAADCLGSYNEVTAATTVTLPSIADVPVGASVCFYVRDASEQVKVFPHHDDRLVLDGTALSDAHCVASPSDATSSGALITFIHDDADGWRSAGFIRTWTDGGHP
jgi:hypothetical protein